MYPVYQIYVLVDFVESNALTTRKKWAFIVPLYVLVVRSHLTNLLISFFSGYSPRSPSVYHHRWVSRKKERKLQCFRGMHLWYWESCYLSALPYSFSFSPQKKTIKIILTYGDFDWLHSRQNNYIFRHSVCIKKRTYFVRFLFYLCLFFVISYFPLLQLL